MATSDEARIPADSGRPRPRSRTPEARAERIARHGAETDPTVVLAAAMRLLESRSRTVLDLRTRLLRAGYPAPLVDGSTDRLVELRLLDDQAYARGWLDSRDRGRPRGERALRQELRLRGVPSDVAAAALDHRRETAAGERHGDDSEEAGAPSADEAAATHLLERRASALARVADPRARRQRAYALLARNGFDPDVAGRVAGRFMAAQAEDPAEPD